MEITVNQQQHQVPDNYSIEELLAFLMPETEKGIAVAINQQIIPKTLWQSHQLSPADNIMLIRATQGG
jgi:sulfur carrier protein